jgi:leader peptidase (prepilin peptidase) / N-methyltransferase
VLVVAYAVVLGALVGALVPRPAHRLSVDLDEPVRTGCGECGTPFPAGLSGWVPLPARCPGCRARLGPSVWLTVLAGALSFGVLTWALWPSPILPAVLLLAGLSLLLVPIDIAVLRLPDPLVAVGFAGSALVVVAASVLTGQYGVLLRAVLAALAMAGGYLLLALLPGARLGLGDVKVAGVLGLVLGWLGWGYVLLGALLPHLLNGPVLLALLLSGRVKRDTAVPLGPALLAGALLAVVVIAGWRRLLLH